MFCERGVTALVKHPSCGSRLIYTTLHEPSALTGVVTVIVRTFSGAGKAPSGQIAYKGSWEQEHEANIVSDNRKSTGVDGVVPCRGEGSRVRAETGGLSMKHWDNDGCKWAYSAWYSLSLCFWKHAWYRLGRRDIIGGNISGVRAAEIHDQFVGL
jgi:hypothetical protein